MGATVASTPPHTLPSPPLKYSRGAGVKVASTLAGASSREALCFFLRSPHQPGSDGRRAVSGAEPPTQVLLPTSCVARSRSCPRWASAFSPVTWE